MKAAERQVGSLKFTHHFGWNCFFTLGEQLILQLSVTQSNNPSPLFSVAPVLGAAALAAGDKFCGKSWPRKSAQDDRWSFCLTVGTLCPANPERPCKDDRAGTTHRSSRQRLRKAMIDREHDLPITKQADVLRISRGSVYYLPRSVSATDLEVMRRAIGARRIRCPAKPLCRPC